MMHDSKLLHRRSYGSFYSKHFYQNRFELSCSIIIRMLPLNLCHIVDLYVRDLASFLQLAYPWLNGLGGY